MKDYSLAEIAKIIGAELKGDPTIRITSIAPLDKAGEGAISFLDNKNYKKLLANTQASAVILHSDNLAECHTAALVMSAPYIGFARLSALFSDIPASNGGIHPTVIIGKNCSIAASASIGPYAIVGDNVIIGEDTHIGAHCVIQQDSQIGTHCRLYDRVTLYYKTQLGNHVTIHSGTVLGADGFGFANEKGKWVKVYQLGCVVIGNHVDIGANTTIDRGALEDTIIEDDVIIDNQVQIAHNVKIGQGSAIAACTGIAGSTTIGKYCQLGGAVMVNGHITVADQVKVVGGTVIYRSIEKAGAYASPMLAQPLNDWLKCISLHQKLPEIAKRFEMLEKMISVYLERSILKRLIKIFKIKGK
jgi:UDP-3-O-[3-hydroxymyristoyl] glucosamine N-acyltransferase